MAVIVAAALAGFAIAVTVAPDPTALWLAKEGSAEHASHAILLIAIVVWAAHSVRGPTRVARSVRLGFTAFLIVVLGEELDWGAVYGLLPGRGGNVHNAWGGASYLLFGVPLAVLVAAALPGGRGIAEALGRAAPSRADAMALVSIPLASLAVALAWDDVEPVFDEFAELALYTALSWLAARALAPATRH